MLQQPEAAAYIYSYCTQRYCAFIYIIMEKYTYVFIDSLMTPLSLISIAYLCQLSHIAKCLTIFDCIQLCKCCHLSEKIFFTIHTATLVLYVYNIVQYSQSNYIINIIQSSYKLLNRLYIYVHIAICSYKLERVTLKQLHPIWSQMWSTLLARRYNNILESVYTACRVNYFMS